MASRPMFRAAALVTTGAGLAYTTYNYTSSTWLTKSTFMPRTVYAEAPVPASSPTKMPWKGFTELTLASSEQVSPNVKKLTFSLPSETTITGLSPITSLLTQHTPEGAWIPVFRPYTPISSAQEPGTLTFLVKKYPGGKGSGKMHSLVPGDTMKFKPIAEFQYTPNAHRSMLLIAGGSGITPIFQLLNVILSNPEDKTKISLVYANNSEQDILLRKELEALEQQFGDRFRKVFTVSNNKASPSDNDISNGIGSSGVHQGYVTKELIGQVWSADPNTGQKVLVSGPPAMIESVAGKKGLAGWSQGSVSGVLAELGYSKDDVYKF